MRSESQEPITRRPGESQDPAETNEASRNRDVDLPADIVVRCPLRNFDLRPVRACDTCEHCAGLTQMQDRGAFHARYMIRCKWPQDRQLFRLAQE